MCHLSRGNIDIIAQSLSKYGHFQHILKQIHSFTQGVTCLTSLLLSETMRLLLDSRAEADDAKR